MTTQTAPDTHHNEVEHSEAEHGMSTRGYITIALILAAITALEVSTYYVDFGPLFLPSLLIMMVIKFIMVVSYFMHLKFDNKLFSWLFYGGLILAVGVYAAALSTFHFFLR
jgi:cytochrome c oxidase subunit 4